METKEVRMLDITAPIAVEVEWCYGRRVLYVHVDGITVLRICRIPKTLVVTDKDDNALPFKYEEHP